jgi:hypothetical protein
MSFQLENGCVYSVSAVTKIFCDMQYHTDLTYDATANTVSATVSDYTGTVQTSWSSPITFNNNGVAQSITPTNGVATVNVDPNVAGEITVSTTVGGIRNGSITFVPNTLKTAQAAQIQQLRLGYGQTMASGFQATIGTAQYTFGWSTDDKANLADTQQSVDKGYLTFPFNYSDINGHPVPISAQTDLNTIEQTATQFFNNQHQQVLSLIGQVNSATTIAAAQAVTWSPATY